MDGWAPNWPKVGGVAQGFERQESLMQEIHYATGAAPETSLHFDFPWLLSLNTNFKIMSF